MLQLIWSRGSRCIDHVSPMRCSRVLPLCSQAHHLHIRSHCRFSVPACRYRCRKATNGSIFLVYFDIIGGRGATGRVAQDFHTTLFFRGLILDTFLRGLWWPNGLKSEVQFEVKSRKIIRKIVFIFRFYLLIDSLLILVVPGPLKVRLSHERSLKKTEKSTC